MKKSVAAIVVTYNRKELLLNNIRACLEQNFELNKIIVIDNHSTDGTKELLYASLSDENIGKVDYIYLEKNSGGSGGFFYGTQYAYEQGYDYLWLMDDDGKPYNNKALGTLMNYVKQNDFDDECFMLNSLVICNDTDLSFGVIQDEKVVYKIDEIRYKFLPNFCNNFNGTLISRHLLQDIGFPRGDYFIKGDEREYLARTTHNHKICGTITDSLYYHPSPLKQDYINILGKKVYNSIESGWKEYYMMRNICTNYKLYDKYSLLKRMRFYLIREAKIILFSNNKFQVLKMSTKGFFHSIIGITGTYYLPDGSIGRNEKMQNYNKPFCV